MWPSIGEYFLYDEVMYYAMTHDERRNASYRAAINQLVKDKTVVDIGTGADAILSRFCVEAGARRVYAIEMLERSYAQAKTLLGRLGLNDKITLIRGDATTVQLPEQVDVCVSELLGMIGSSEGVIGILNDAQRFLKDGGVMIPTRSVTKIAAVSLPQELAERPQFTELSGPYVERIFETVGHPFDVRVCIRHFPPEHVQSDSQIFEDLDFRGHIEPEFHNDIRLTITKSSKLDGLLLWLNLHTIEGESIDVLTDELVWLPVFFPVFYPGVDVRAGDVISAMCSCTSSTNSLTPDYRVRGTIHRQTGDHVDFDYDSSHRARSFRKTPFYEVLFADGPVAKYRKMDGAALTSVLKTFLGERLSAHMVPSDFVLLKSLPLTPSGKVDRRALPASDRNRSGGDKAFVAPRTPEEEELARVWTQVLGVDRVGVTDNFFELGGHSLMATQVISRVRDIFSTELPLQRIFESPSVATLTQAILEAQKRGGNVASSMEPLSREQHRVELS